GANHGDRFGWEKLRGRHKQIRSVVFPERGAPLDSGIGAGWRRIHAGIRRWGFFGAGNSAAERLGVAHTTRGTGKEFRSFRTGSEECSQARVVYLPGGASRIDRDRSESGGGRAWEVVTRFRFSDNGNAGDEAHERRGSADRGFEHVQGVHNGDGHGNSAPGRPAGTALASERSRMAVLHRGQSKNDGGGHREQSANDGFPGGRRGIR